MSRITKGIMQTPANLLRLFRAIQTTRIEVIIGVLMVGIGLFGLAVPSQNAIKAAEEGRPAALIVAMLLSGSFLACGTWMFKERISDRQMIVFISPIVFYTVLIVARYIYRPETFLYSPVIPMMFCALSWIIMSYTLSEHRVTRR